VFLLPCLEQAMMDSETAVVTDAVRCVAAVCDHLRKRSLLKAASKVAPLLQHSSTAVRSGAIAFIAAAAHVLPPADVYTQLRVLLEGLLKCEPLLLTDQALLARCLALPSPAPHPPPPADPLAHLTHTPAPAAPAPATTPPPASQHQHLPFLPLPSSSTEQHQPFASPLHTPRSYSPQHPADRVLAEPSLVNLKRHLAVHREGDSELLLRPPAPVYTIDVDPGSTYQTRWGLGACRCLRMCSCCA
jgi:hypothetical protein